MEDEDRHAETYGRRMIASAIIASTLIFSACLVFITMLILYFG